MTTDPYSHARDVIERQLGFIEDAASKSGLPDLRQRAWGIVERVLDGEPWGPVADDLGPARRDEDYAKAATGAVHIANRLRALREDDQYGAAYLEADVENRLRYPAPPFLHAVQ